MDNRSRELPIRCKVKDIKKQLPFFYFSWLMCICHSSSFLRYLFYYCFPFFLAFLLNLLCHIIKIPSLPSFTIFQHFPAISLIPYFRLHLTYSIRVYPPFSKTSHFIPIRKSRFSIFDLQQYICEHIFQEEIIPKMHTLDARLFQKAYKEVIVAFCYSSYISASVHSVCTFFQPEGLYISNEIFSIFTILIRQMHTLEYYVFLSY